MGADSLHRSPHFVFFRLRNTDVVDGTALDADEVVVVTRHPLSGLVASDTLDTEMWHDHAGLLEDRERPIQR